MRFFPHLSVSLAKILVRCLTQGAKFIHTLISVVHRLLQIIEIWASIRINFPPCIGDNGLILTIVGIRLDGLEMMYPRLRF
jgi:hypothetical protein